jgi:hypothetical protein
VGIGVMVAEGTIVTGGTWVSVAAGVGVLLVGGG